MIIQRTLEEIEFMKEVGRLIRKHRREKKMSQRELAVRIGYKDGYSVSLLETAMKDELSITIIFRIASALEIDWKLLIPEESLTPLSL